MFFQRLQAGLGCPILSEKTHPFEHAVHRYSPWWASGVCSLNLTFDAISTELQRTRGAHPGFTSLPWSQLLFIVYLQPGLPKLSASQAKFLPGIVHL